MSIKSVMPSNHLILCRPLLLLPSIFPSIRVFSKESVLCIRWPKYWSFSCNISPFNEYSGLISFRMDWLDLLVVQGTLKSLLQHHSSKSWWASQVLLILPRVVYQLLFPWLATVLIYLLECRTDHVGWLLAYKKWEQKCFHAQEPQRVLLVLKWRR